MRTEETAVIFSLAFINSRLTDYLTYARLTYGIKQMGAVQAEAQAGKYVVHSFLFVKRNSQYYFAFLLEKWIPTQEWKIIAY